LSSLESEMKKFSTIAAAAALAVAAAAPVAADDAKVNSDPFVSTQGPVLGALVTGFAVPATVFIIGAVAAQNDGT